MKSHREYGLTNSHTADDGHQTREQIPQAISAALTVRPPRSTARWARRNLVRTAITSAIVALGLVGVGVGVAAEASAKPMERERVRYCAKLIRDVNFTIDAYHAAVKRYGEDNALTRQAGSNSERAQNRYADSGC